MSTSPLDSPFAVTLFSSYAATSKTQEHVTLDTLATRIRATTATAKDKLPWLKLARFGVRRTEHACLRNDANVLAITGIEADYDGELLTLEHAVEKLTQAGVLALVYTSPSHTEQKPRWRVLCPLSVEYEPGRRSHFLGRLNGLLRGIFSGESWTLSQSYYYGAVGAAVSHTVVTIEGEPIDLLDDLDRSWIGKPGTHESTSGGAGDAPRSGPLDESAMVDAVMTGENYHEATIRLVGLWARGGFAMLDAETRILEQFDQVSPDKRDDRWRVRRADVARCVEWVYGREVQRRDRDGKLAAVKPRGQPEQTVEQAGEASRPLSVIRPTDLAGLPVPARVWLVEDWLPIGSVTLLYSDGGTGKTLLVQQLATSLATGRPWIGLPITACRVFGLFCEDDENEVHRRQERINAAYGIEYADLKAFAYACPVGDDNVLVRFEYDGSWTPTPRYAELIKQVADFDAQLLIIDTAADTFGGNENDRSQVRAYLGALLTRLARDANCAVLLNAHPSRAGMSPGNSMDSGSTAWSNTARSRWAMIVPRSENGAVQDPDLRILSRRKSNYARAGDEIELRYFDGVLKPANATGPSATERVSRIVRAKAVFLALLNRLERNNLFVSAHKNAGNYAPKLFAQQPDRNGCTRADFEAAMHDLLAGNELTMIPYGRKGDQRYRLARPTPASSEEAATDHDVVEWRDACREAGFQSPTEASEQAAAPVARRPAKRTRKPAPKQVIVGE